MTPGRTEDPDMKTKSVRCARMIPNPAWSYDPYDSHDCYGEDCCAPRNIVCGAPAIETTTYHREVPDGSRGVKVVDVVCSVCDAPPVEEKCSECGQAAAYDGLCYQCQTVLHAIGAYDMDGEGWN